jgi:hypothetical protein
VTSDGVLKILDFGLAKVISSATSAGLTQAGMLLGTPHYMSPEQIRGEEVDTRSDLYALGVVLYEALTGRVPYDGSSLNSLVLAALNGDLTPVSEMRPDCPAELERIVLKALSRSREERYATPADMLADLDLLAVSNDMPRGQEAWTDFSWQPPLPAPTLDGSRCETGRERQLRSLGGEIDAFPLGMPFGGPSQGSFSESGKQRVRVASLGLLLLLGAMEPRGGQRTLQSESSLESAAAQVLEAVRLPPADASPERAQPVVTSLAGPIRSGAGAVKQLVPAQAGHPGRPAPIVEVTRIERVPALSAEPSALTATPHARPKQVAAGAPGTTPRPRSAIKRVAQDKSQSGYGQMQARRSDRRRGRKLEVEHALQLTDVVMRDALSAYLQGRLTEAHELYRRAVKELPAAPEAWRGLGLVAARLGRYAEARRALSRYLSLAPEAVDAGAIADRKRDLR